MSIFSQELTLNNFPMFELYMCDFLQLNIIIKELKITDDKTGKTIGYIQGYCEHEEEENIGICMMTINLYWVGRAMVGKEIDDSMIDYFLNQFRHTWFHEYLHVIGITDDGIANLDGLMGASLGNEIDILDSPEDDIEEGKSKFKSQKSLYIS